MRGANVHAKTEDEQNKLLSGCWLAATTVGPKLSVMQVTCAMTAATVFAPGLHLIERTSMAVIACHFEVRAGKGEFSLQIMVKRQFVPPDRVMARAA